MMILSIVLLIAVLGLIIFVHELGHFVMAKLFGIRVDEFGMGFPPRAWKLFSYRGTDYTLNWIPFGGFVKIYGEDSLPENDPDYHRSMVAKPWWQQIIVLVAGVTMNVMLAWIIFSAMFFMGTPSVVGPGMVTKGPAELTVLQVGESTPAARDGIVTGDVIKKVSYAQGILVQPTPESFTSFVQAVPENTPLTIDILRKGVPMTLHTAPVAGIIPDKVALGVSLNMVAETEGLPFFTSLAQGWHLTIATLKDTAHGFGQLISGEIGVDHVSGPIGLTKIIGSAEQIGAHAVWMLIAMISLNLALINILPFPALDGGRVLFVLIETVSRRKLPPSFVFWVNTGAFILLIGLMILISIKDVIHLF
jgi:regulator of sigma E protease